MSSKALASVETPYLALREPDTLQELLEENIGDEGFSVSSLPRVVAPSGGMTYWAMPDGVAVPSFEGIVIHKQKKRVYWAKKLGEGEIAPPDCAAPDGKTGFARRDENGEPLMWAESGGCMSCKDCPFAQWGSGRGNGQACALRMDLFVLMEGKLLPIVLSLATTSVPVAEKSFADLLVDGIGLSRVVLTFGLEKMTNGSNPYARLTIKRARVLPQEEAALAKTYKEGIVPFLRRAA